jgi:hypothetical protein
MQDSSNFKISQKVRPRSAALEKVSRRQYRLCIKTAQIDSEPPP